MSKFNAGELALVLDYQNFDSNREPGSLSVECSWNGRSISGNIYNDKIGLFKSVKKVPAYNS